MVDCLAEERLRAPGHTLPLARLFESGWPGERALPAAADRRVYTALWTLRKLGLRELLIRREDGYLFDPGVPLVRLDA
jgi:hypothetical protein